METDIQTKTVTPKQIFIDKFFVPKNGINEFKQRMQINRNFIKKLSGFIEDAAYEQFDEKGNLVVVTIAKWENQEALGKAKEAVQAEYRRTNFNPAEMYQRLQIKMERGTYSESAD